MRNQPAKPIAPGMLCVIVGAPNVRINGTYVTIVKLYTGNSKDIKRRSWHFKDASRPITTPRFPGLSWLASEDQFPHYLLVLEEYCLIPIQWPDGENEFTQARNDLDDLQHELQQWANKEKQK